MRSRNVPFEPLHLTRKQQQQCQDLTFQLLDHTLRSYDERNDCADNSGASRHHANLDRNHWKQLKTQANASLYIERTSDAWRDLNLPVANGTTQVSCWLWEPLTALSMKSCLGWRLQIFRRCKFGLRPLLNKHPIDGAILAQLAGPTEIDPFQFMGVTWFVGQRTWPFKLVAHTQDFVVVSATGLMTHTNGELIGYEVVQSIDLPQCPPLPKPTVRGKIMCGAIYRQ